MRPLLTSIIRLRLICKSKRTQKTSFICQKFGDSSVEWTKHITDESQMEMNEWWKATDENERIFSVAMCSSVGLLELVRFIMDSNGFDELFHRQELFFFLRHKKKELFFFFWESIPQRWFWNMSILWKFYSTFGNNVQFPEAFCQSVLPTLKKKEIGFVEVLFLRFVLCFLFCGGFVRRASEILLFSPTNSRIIVLNLPKFYLKSWRSRNVMIWMKR